MRLAHPVGISPRALSAWQAYGGSNAARKPRPRTTPAASKPTAQRDNRTPTGRAKQALLTAQCAVQSRIIALRNMRPSKARTSALDKARKELWDLGWAACQL